jgi:hypothetical protein
MSTGGFAPTGWGYGRGSHSLQRIATSTLWVLGALVALALPSSLLAPPPAGPGFADP